MVQHPSGNQRRHVGSAQKRLPDRGRELGRSGILQQVSRGLAAECLHRVARLTVLGEVNDLDIGAERDIGMPLLNGLDAGVSRFHRGARQDGAQPAN